jgi:hypothetical protein
LTASEVNEFLQQGVLVFDDAAARDAALTPIEGMVAFTKDNNQTRFYDGTNWVLLGKQDVETTKNFQSFTASGGTSVPDWATKMYYLIVRGGNTGETASSGINGGAGGAGGQVVQGDTAVTGGTSLTITVGGAASNSSVAISGGSTFTASTTGAAGGSRGGGSGSDGTLPSAPFNVAYFGGGGGGGAGSNDAQRNKGHGGGGVGGQGGNTFVAVPTGPGYAGEPNSGGGGGGGGGNASNQVGGTGGSGIVLLYFS